jgi:hypothetical protein
MVHSSAVTFCLAAVRRAVLAWAVAAGCAVVPSAPPAFRFALMGDFPYSQAQANLLDGLIEQLNREPLAFVAHVGDITSGEGPCGDEWLEARQRQFARIRHPFVLLPGDNEWTDCHRSGFDPLERLDRWRRLFCRPVAGLALVRQPGAYCENVRWESGGVVFAGVNVPGSNNNLGRTAPMDAEHHERMRAVLAWLDEARTRARDGRRLVVLMQGNPFLEPNREADGFRALREWLRRTAHESTLDLVLVHGDTHRHRDDAPLPRLRRLEVPGSPQLRWLRASLHPDALRIELADPP